MPESLIYILLTKTTSNYRQLLYWNAYNALNYAASAFLPD